MILNVLLSISVNGLNSTTSIDLILSLFSIKTSTISNNCSLVNPSLNPTDIPGAITGSNTSISMLKWIPFVLLSAISIDSCTISLIFLVLTSLVEYTFIFALSRLTCSSGSISLAPIITVFSFLKKFPLWNFVSLAPLLFVIVARGSPWMFPEVVVSNVLKSGCVSTQITPRLSSCEISARAEAITTLWSPPIVNGNTPSSLADFTMLYNLSLNLFNGSIFFSKSFLSLLFT